MDTCDECKNIEYHEIIDCIMSALDARDAYTAGHSQRVSDMAVAICRMIGADILSRSEHLKELTEIVLYHHERYDGKGYPKGLKGVEIPMGARIVAICDSIDAMTSNRCYRKAHSVEFCYQEIENNLGKMYDPILGKYVLDNWESIRKVVEGEAKSQLSR